MYDFTPVAAFNTIDDCSLGYLDEKNLKRFFRNMGHVASWQEIVSLIRRLDTNGDCRISKEELVEGLTSYEKKVVKKTLK
jgi:Ca2+-binding EF-hand superfamily protein